jgi:hypothetical protein
LAFALRPVLQLLLTAQAGERFGVAHLGIIWRAPTEGSVCQASIRKCPLKHGSPPLDASSCDGGRPPASRT